MQFHVYLDSDEYTLRKNIKPFDEDWITFSSFSESSKHSSNSSDGVLRDCWGWLDWLPIPSFLLTSDGEIECKKNVFYFNEKHPLFKRLYWPGLYLSSFRDFSGSFFTTTNVRNDHFGSFIVQAASWAQLSTTGWIEGTDKGMKPEVNRPLRSLFIPRRTERGRGGDFSGDLTILG